MKPMVGVFSLVSLFVLLFLASPVPVLRIRVVENGSILYCAPLTNGDEILSDSINSIYNVPVRERWRVREDGAIQVVDVVSSAAVMEYYHLDDFADAGGGLFRGAPPDRFFSEVLIKVDTRGQERLIVQGQEIALYLAVPEASVVEIAVRSAPRFAACA